MLKTSPELLAYQKQYRMSWDNYGVNGWHVDHIRPLSSFYLTDNNQLEIACHYTNMQPLWGKDNIKKGAKYDGTITLD
jgi:hypothetical protein